MPVHVRLFINPLLWFSSVVFQANGRMSIRLKRLSARVHVMFSWLVGMVMKNFRTSLPPPTSSFCLQCVSNLGRCSLKGWPVGSQLSLLTLTAQARSLTMVKQVGSCHPMMNVH